MLGALGTTLKSTTEAAERLKMMVGRLQSFVRVDEAKQKSVDLSESIDSTLSLMQNQLQEGSVEVVRCYGADLPQVHCRPAEINQVLMHLLQNAIDAIDGTGTITITTTHDPQRVSVAIADTGRGMEPEEFDGLFDPGFAGRSRVKLGMGLALSHQIVTRHGGELRVESAPGQGSTFTMVLPMSSSRSETAS